MERFFCIGGIEAREIVRFLWVDSSHNGIGVRLRKRKESVQDRGRREREIGIDKQQVLGTGLHELLQKNIAPPLDERFVAQELDSHAHAATHALALQLQQAGDICGV